jgi:hypothetical protein
MKVDVNINVKNVLSKFDWIIATIIRVSIIILMITSAYSRDWTIFFLSALVLFLTFFPKMVKRKWKLELPSELEILIVLLLYTGVILGDIKGYYLKFWWWDILLHGVGGLALGFTGFLMMFTLYELHKVKANPGVVVFFSFCFAMAAGALWEIFEFAMDSSFGFNMQRSGLVDTMADLIVDALGALFASLVGYIYLKGKKTRIFEGLLRRFVEKNPHLFNSISK